MLISRVSRRRLRLIASALLLISAVAQPCRANPASTEFWTVSTRDTVQILGSSPDPLSVCQLNAQGNLSPRDPATLLASSVGRSVVVVVHGNVYSAKASTEEGLRIRDDLTLPPNAIIVAFDWPSQRIYPNPVRDGNEKGRRAFVAGYHLARFLQRFPDGSRLTLIGHSHGSLAVLAGMHLLGGGILDDGRGSATQLTSRIPQLRLRAVLIAAAVDHQWLDPGERFDRALSASEAILSLYNDRDPILGVHPYGRYSDRGKALGKVGLSEDDRCRLGSQGAKICERNIAGLIGMRHTFDGAVADPVIESWISAYAW